MKLFACGDVVPGCDAAFAEPTEELLLLRVGAHAAEAHGVPEVSPELLGAVRARIRTASPA
ncbi:DUF1059 domain-containing protein [Quadrisphaera sp. DSM 44207]|uniref:DUF1059 domain-containing protein n=1 Tax=Quadrisphaera sp. DSM 44207 TaxID=1881057 RepID=UPI00088C7F29|nr:DUF1059 domain-containing protein [Quadrisphaera sp. DSM 44207]SDQ46905.1 Predicted small metal-binding protein [Quadrisphaera sp. DSM 44207]